MISKYATPGQLLRVAAPLLVIFWALSYFGVMSGPKYDDVVRTFRGEKAAFVADFLDHEIDGRFDGTGIERLCAQKKWVPGLMMSCAPPAGGIGNVRNAQLHCIRFAIEAGAELILPEIVRRNDRDITRLAPDSGGPIRGDPLSYFFDVDFLKTTLATYCPQMRVHNSMNDLYDVIGILDPINMQAEMISQDKVNGTVLARPHAWATEFHAWLETESPAEKRRYPLRVHVQHPVTFVWPVASDLPEVERNFGRLLRVRADARTLAASALYNLRERFGLAIDPKGGPSPRSFAGVHLRTEVDAAAFPDYPTQASAYLNYLVQAGVSVGYLATGAIPEQAEVFARRARDFDIAIVGKRDLLADAELRALDGLSWDQRALVDYEVMLRAGGVAGPSQSPFAWNLALRRAYAFGQGPDHVADPVSDTVDWVDEFTTLYWKNGRRPAMRATIWP